MTPTALLDALTSAQCREALKAFLEALHHLDEKRDSKKFVADLKEAVKLCERYAQHDQLGT